MKRLILWSVWMFSGLIALILLAAIIKTLFEKPSLSSMEIIEQRIDTFEFDSFAVGMPLKDETKTDDEVQDIIKRIHNREGYSNPARSEDDDEDISEELITKRPRRRPLRPIGTDFNPNQSFVIRHANGTLTYIFPTNYSTVRPSRRPARTDPPAQSKIDYPVELIDKIMTINRASFEGAFGEDVVIPEGDALNRRSDTPDEPFLCESSERLTHPQEGQTRNNSKVWIVNTKNYKQGIRVEICRYPGDPCRYCDFDSICKQVYHYRTLVAVDKKTNELYKEQILLQSSCKCAKL